MKLKTIYQISLLTVSVLLGSCIGDLDVKPIDPNITSSANVYSTPESYKQGLAKLYAAFVLTGQQGPSGQPDVAGVDEGFSCFIRSMWNLEELTTDEAVWTYPNDANSTIFNLHYHTWLPSDGIPTALFARIMNVAVLTNEYIRASSGSSNADVKRYNKEARFLRALTYYYGINFFGNMPFVTEADKPGAFLPNQISRAELFAYVESELKAIYDDLGDPKFEYGRADKAVASMLLAKLYMNAEVFLGPGNTKYTEAITELNKVISGPYSLAPKYINNFLADNHTSPEMIFSFNNDGAKSQAYDPVWIMIKGNAGGGGWAGLRTTSAFVSLFDNNPNDIRANFYDESNGQSREITQVNVSTQGYGVNKFRNILSTGGIPANDATGFIDTDFPLFRLADAYLMYAEAVLRGGSGGSMSTALGYVNALRNRSGESMAIGDITMGELTLDFILDERGRELHWEGHRRTDLIRFGKFVGGAYLWPWKGGIAEGRSTEAHRVLFPIPASDLATNPKLKQNPGYN
jgi:starch-binding outer membrane protein, SusD/RagB family